MNRRRDRATFLPGVVGLECRKLLSGDLRIHPLAALESSAQHHPFVAETANRRAIAGSVTHLLSEAFQAFAYHAFHVPIKLPGSDTAITGPNLPPSPEGPISGVPVGITPDPPILSNELALLDAQVQKALATRELDTSRVPPSVARGPRFTLLAQDALIPFAREQIAALGRQLQQDPAGFTPQGTLADSTTLKAVDSAYDRILDAVAENAVHPKLFRSPGDFYDNPVTAFTIEFGGDPVGAGPNFFLLGPGGIPLRPAR